MNNSFLDSQEIEAIGFKKIGACVQISRYARFYAPDKITLGDYTRIDDFAVLSGGKGISIGRYVHLASACQIFGGGGVEIEDFSGISGRAAIYSISDNFSGTGLTNPTIPDQFRTPPKIAPVLLRKHSIIGTASTILPGVEIGEGSAIGAHSLIAKSCIPWKVYFGVPARVIKSRNKGALESEYNLLNWEEESE